MDISPSPAFRGQKRVDPVMRSSSPIESNTPKEPPPKALLYASFEANNHLGTPNLLSPLPPLSSFFGRRDPSVPRNKPASDPARNRTSSTGAIRQAAAFMFAKNKAENEIQESRSLSVSGSASPHSNTDSAAARNFSMADYTIDLAKLNQSTQGGRDQFVMCDESDMNMPVHVRQQSGVDSMDEGPGDFTIHLRSHLKQRALERQEILGRKDVRDEQELRVAQDEQDFGDEQVIESDSESEFRPMEEFGPLLPMQSRTKGSKQYRDTSDRYFLHASDLDEEYVPEVIHEQQVSPFRKNATKQPAVKAQRQASVDTFANTMPFSVDFDSPQWSQSIQSRLRARSDPTHDKAQPSVHNVVNGDEGRDGGGSRGSASGVHISAAGSSKADSHNNSSRKNSSNLTASQLTLSESHFNKAASSINPSSKTELSKNEHSKGESSKIYTVYTYDDSESQFRVLAEEVRRMQAEIASKNAKLNEMNESRRVADFKQHCRDEELRKSQEEAKTLKLFLEMSRTERDDAKMQLKRSGQNLESMQIESRSTQTELASLELQLGNEKLQNRKLNLELQEARAVKNSIEKIQRENQQLRQQEAEYRTRQQRMVAETEQLISASEAKAEEANPRLEKLEEEKHSIELEVENARSEMAAMQKDLDHGKALVQTLTSDLNGAENTDTTSTKLQEENQQLRQQIIELQVRQKKLIAEAKEVVSASDDEAHEAKTSLKKSQQNIATIESKMEATESRLVAAALSLKHEKARVRTLKSDVQKAQEEAARAQDEAKEARGAMTKARDEMTKAKDEMTKARDEMKKARDEMKKAKDEANSIQDEAKDPDHGTKQAQQDVDEMKKKYAALKLKLKKSQDEAKLAKEDVKHVQIVMSQSMEETEELKKKCATLNSRLRKTQEALVRTKEALLAQSEEFEKFQKERETMVDCLFYEWGKNEVGPIEMTYPDGSKKTGMGFRYKYAK